MGRFSTPPFRADHVGSLLRPDNLLKARDDHAAGRIDEDELKAVEDEAIREVVRMQEDVGLQSATDGEFRRTSWHMDFIYQLGGVEQVEGESLHVQFHNEEGEYDYAPPAMQVADRVTLPKTIFADAFEFLRDTVDEGHSEADDPVSEHGPLPRRELLDRPVRLPGHRGVLDRPDGRVCRGGAPAWRDLGCTYLQLDDTSLAYVNDPAQREHIVGRSAAIPTTCMSSTSPTSTASSPGGPTACRSRPTFAVATTSRCGRPRAATTSWPRRCSATWRWTASSSSTTTSARARSSRCASCPRTSASCSGLVTTKRPELEDKDMLKRRIEEASQYVDVDQLCLSGQCGFSSTVEGNQLTRDDQGAKLRLIVEVAEEVWG